MKAVIIKKNLIISSKGQVVPIKNVILKNKQFFRFSA